MSWRATGSRPSDRRAVAAALVVEVERLYRLIEDLVVYGRAASAGSAEQEPVLVSRVVLEVIDQERELVSDHRIAFSGPKDAVADAADTAMVRHVVRNLLDNAVSYAPAGERSRSSSIRPRTRWSFASSTTAR